MYQAKNFFEVLFAINSFVHSRHLSFRKGAIVQEFGTMPP